jgi:hypothetical protein
MSFTHTRALAGLALIGVLAAGCGTAVTAQHTAPKAPAKHHPAPTHAMVTPPPAAPTQAPVTTPPPAAPTQAPVTAPPAAPPPAPPTHAPVVAPPAPPPPPPTAPANPIPQGNGGDHDGDNNGGPSDGDGNV